MVDALENMYGIRKSFCLKMCYTVTAIKHKRDCIRMLFRTIQKTVDSYGGNLTSNIEINVLLNQSPVCLFYQTNCGFNVYESRQYGLKEFRPFLSFHCPSAGTKANIT